MKRGFGGQDPAELSADYQSVFIRAVHSTVLPAVFILFLYGSARPEKRRNYMKADRGLFCRRNSPVFRKRSVAALSHALPGNHSIICHYAGCRIYFSVDGGGVNEPLVKKSERTGRCIQRRKRIVHAGNPFY